MTEIYENSEANIENKIQMMPIIDKYGSIET